MDNWKAQLLGQTRITDEEEFKIFKKEMLTRSFELEKSVSRCVCTQCKNIFEIDDEVLSGLLNTMSLMGNSPEISITKKTDFRKYYFQISYCYHCEPVIDFRIEIKLIS